MSTCPTCARSYESPARFCPDDGTALVLSPPRDPLIGRLVLGTYRVTGVAGQGAAGVVYAAHDERMGRRVAIKILHHELSLHEPMRRRFIREARAIAAISHPNVIRVLDVGEVAGRPALVMEYISGRCLTNLLAAETLSQERVVAIVRQVAAALAETHARGVVHRDLKPANLMITQRRHAGDVVTVLDFGVAKLTGAMVDPGASRLTRDGEIFGTPHYVSPEQANGDEVDERSDIYSLGVVLYELLTGRVPFRGPAVAVLMGHLGRAPAPPRSIDPRIAPALAGIAMRCLEKRRADRFASATELVDALDAWSRDAHVDSVDDSHQWRAAAESHLDVVSFRAPRRRWRVLAMAALLALGITGDRVATRWLRTDTAGSAPAASHRATAEEPPHAPDAPPHTEPTDPAHALAHRRAVVVAQKGYSLRVLLPHRLVAGVSYDMVLDAWDPQGAALEAPEMVVTLERPDGSSRGIAARPARRAGRYRFQRAFTQPGIYQLRVFPPTGNATIRLFFEVDPAGSGRELSSVSKRR